MPIYTGMRKNRHFPNEKAPKNTGRKCSQLNKQTDYFKRAENKLNLFLLIASKL